MPQQLNSIGTRYVGATHRLEDNSFITTSWFCFLMPLIPYKSERVLYKGSSSSFSIGSSNTAAHYSIIERVKLDTRLILKYYGITALLLLLPLATLLLSLAFLTINSGMIIFLITTIPFWIWGFLMTFQLALKAK
jgi:hypothetical protein